MDLSRVASTLLDEVTEPHAAAVLLRSAELSEGRTTAVPLPAEAVTAELSAPVHRTETAARSCDDPVLLDRLSRDSRLSVRRAVAANRHSTLPGTRARLLAKAYKVGDEDSLSSLVEYLPATEMLATRPTKGKFPSHKLAEETIRAGQRDQLAALVRSTDPVLCARAVTACAVGRWPEGVEGMTFEDALGELHGNPMAVEALSVALLSAPRLDALWADTLRKYPGVWDRAASLRTSAFKTAVDTRNGAPQTCDAAAFERLCGQGSEEFTAWLCGRVLDDDVLGAAVEVLRGHPAPEVCGPFLSSNGSRLDAHMANRLLEAVLDAGAMTPPFAVLAFNTVSAPLRPEVRSRLAAQAVRTLLVPWVAGNWPRHSPADAAEVVAAVAATRPGELTEVGRDFTSDLAQAAHVDTFVDACGAEVHASMLSNPSVAAYVARRLCRELGDDPDLWQTALALLTDWSASIGDLIDATYLTLGRTRTPTPGEPVELTEGPDGQLALQVP